MRVSHRSGLFGGVALLACATILLEIALARLYSALFGQHVALLALSLSLLGAGVGGVLLYVIPRLARPPALFASLATLSSLASGAAVAAVMVLVQLRPITDLEPRSLLWLTLAYATSALPFALSGVAVAAAIRHAATDMPRLYLVDLLGAAAGGLAAALALRTGAQRAVLVAAVLLAASGIFFYAASRANDGERRAPGGLVATFALGTAVLFAGDVGTPWLKLSSLRWAELGKVDLQIWSDLGLITVDRARSGTAWMRLDGTAATSILDAKTSPPAHPDEMAYVLHRDQGPVLVIGAGGGRDIRAALKAGQKDVHAVEINRRVVDDVMRDRYAEFSDRLFDKPEVHVAVTDGRTYARRTPLQFRNVVIAPVDTATASAAGALSLSESRLYNVEGFGDLLERLLPEGTLLASRSDGEFERLLALAAAGLRRAGAAEPKDHLFACSASRSTSLLIKRTPLARDEIDALRRFCRKSRFTEAFAPDRPQNELRGRLVAMADARAAAPDAATDLTPPTDDRPFFFYNVPARRLPALLRDPKALRAEHAGLLALLALLLGSSALGALCVVGPSAVRPRSGAGGGREGGAEPAPLARPPHRFSRARALLFFTCIGAGFALVEIALVQHLVMLLGHAASALPTVLLVLLFSAGIGSLLTARIAPASASASAATLAEVLVGALALAAVGLGPLLQRGLGLPLGGRLALTVSMLVPLGVLIGVQVPLGVKLVASRTPDLIPWCWGLCAIAGVIATASGVLLAVNLGYSALLLGAGLAYLVAAAAVPPAGTLEADLGGRAPTEVGADVGRQVAPTS